MGRPIIRIEDFSPTTASLVLGRRGRLHAYETLEPRRTALIVIDMQHAFLDPGMPGEVPAARAIIPNINRVAETLRRAGGAVAWSQGTFGDERDDGWDAFFGAMLSPEAARAVRRNLSPGSPGWQIGTGLDVKAADFVFPKRRFSAFVRGASDLEPWLRERGLDTLLIAGTLTNVCCESTARDAVQLGFRAVMIADANATRDEAGHRATLDIFLQSFGDVRTTDETIALLEESAAQHAHAAE